MKTKKNSKQDLQHPDFEKNDHANLKRRVTKKDRTTKRKLSIYDEFEEESSEMDFDNPFYDE